MKVLVVDCFIDAGHLISRLNEEALSKDDPSLRRFKDCLDAAAQAVFDGKATVQLAGSVAKGTTNEFSADIDTFVRHVGVVTPEQRDLFANTALASFRRNNIETALHLGSHRIQFYQIRMYTVQDEWQPFPEVDVVFNYYKDKGENKPPNYRKFADSPLAQQAVRYLKRLPSSYLNAPKGTPTENFVLEVEAMMDKDSYTSGKSFLDDLLKHAFSSIYQGKYRYMESTQMANEQWQEAALSVLLFREQYGGWPWREL